MERPEEGAAVLVDDEDATAEAALTLPVPCAPDAIMSLAVEVVPRVDVMGVKDREEVFGLEEAVGLEFAADCEPDAWLLDIPLLADPTLDPAAAVLVMTSVVPGAVVVTIAVVGVEVGGSVENVLMETPGMSVSVKLGPTIEFVKSSVLTRSR